MQLFLLFDHLFISMVTFVDYMVASKLKKKVNTNYDFAKQNCGPQEGHI